MKRAILFSAGLAVVPSLSMGCGVDWSLPTNHFEGVEEHGYVSYWEKIGEADLGDGLVIPVHISFNSHREASSPYLGKGWMVALLESHVEPVDENTLNVIMPDGWTFIFYRNGDTETWRGNASWVGETNNTVFTITAPCGWKIKFDQGKIQEIDSNTNRTLTYRYDGGVATEVDEGSNAFVKAENNPATGLVSDLVIGGQKIDLAQAQRPRVMTKLKQNLLTGFDQSLSQLKRADGTVETFAFGTTDKNLDPNLLISYPDHSWRKFTWDPTTRQIKTDGVWSYTIIQSGDVQEFSRTNDAHQNEYYLKNTGTEVVSTVDGIKTIKTWFTTGALTGKVRDVKQIINGKSFTVSHRDYDENGHI